MKKTIAIFILFFILIGFTNAMNHMEDDDSEWNNWDSMSQFQNTKMTKSDSDEMSQKEKMEDRIKKMRMRAENMKEESQKRNKSMDIDLKKKRDEAKRFSKEKMNTFRNKLKEIRNNKNDDIEKNNEMMKNNRMDFRRDNWSMKKAFWELWDDMKTSLKDIHEAFRNESEKIKELIKENYSDDDLRKEYVLELENLRKNTYEETINVLWDNTEVIDFLNERKKIVSKNSELRKQNLKSRLAYRGDISDLVTKQKTKLIDRIQKWLDKMSNSKLERILKKLDIINTKFEKAKISDAKKEEIASKIIALKEIIEEKLEANNSDEEELNIEDLLNIN